MIGPIEVGIIAALGLLFVGPRVLPRWGVHLVRQSVSSAVEQEIKSTKLRTDWRYRPQFYTLLLECKANDEYYKPG